MATKHSVAHQGFIFTRKSAGRVYSHAVLVQGSRSADRAYFEASARRHWLENVSYYQSKVDGTCELFAKYPSQYTPERIAKEQAEAAEVLAAGIEGNVAERMANYDRSRAGGQVAADGDTYFWCAGWCGRADLAAKLAASKGGFALPAVIG